VNAGVNAARSAGIAAVTAAITGGDPARAALGGLVSGASGVIPYVGPIVGAGAAAEVQGGKFATGAIGAGIGMGTFAGTSFLLSKLGDLQGAVDTRYARNQTGAGGRASSDVFRVQQADESRLVVEGELAKFRQQYQNMRGLKFARDMVKSLEIAPNRSEPQIIQFFKSYGRHLAFKGVEKLLGDIEYSKRESLIGSYSYQDGPVEISDGWAADSSS